MKIHKLVCVLILLTVGVLCAFWHQTRAESAVAETLNLKTESLFLLNYLSVLGKSYDCFFTVETAWTEEKPTDSLETLQLESSSDSRSLRQELEQLHKTIPNFTYKFDKVNPRIVHIIDARLLQWGEYGLGSIVKNIDYTGKINDLPQELKKQGIPVSPQVVNLRESRDYNTIVAIKQTNVQVRNALSNFVPLEERRGGILWIARTKLKPGELTYVYYPAWSKKS